MGIDLTLLPFECEEFQASFDVLFMDRDYKLFDEIRNIIDNCGKDVANNFKSYFPDDSETQYGITTEDAYGSKIKFIYSEDFLKIKKLKLSKKNQAIMNFLKTEDMYIALYWN